MAMEEKRLSLSDSRGTTAVGFTDRVGDICVDICSGIIDSAKDKDKINLETAELDAEAQILDLELCNNGNILCFQTK